MSCRDEGEKSKPTKETSEVKTDTSEKSQDETATGTDKTNGESHKSETETGVVQPEAKTGTIESDQKVEKKDASDDKKDTSNENKTGDTEMKDTSAEKQDSTTERKNESAEKQTETTSDHAETLEKQDRSTENKNKDTEKKEETSEESKDQETAKGTTSAPEKLSATNGDAVEAHARDDKVPSSILEKGIMYLMYRGRVNVQSPDSVEDLARSFLILRPLPHGAKLSDGPIGDEKNCRLIAIPKKTLPVSGKDKWTAFVETSNTSFAELKDTWMKSDTYQTQAGERETPAAAPAAECVYAITTTGRESHLAYITTLPEDLGKLQNDLGLRAKGSFVLSTKNPKAPGPANTNLGKDPGFPEEIQSQFRSLRWAPTKPEHLNYEGSQFLMIGEGEKGLEKATEQQEGDEDKIAPKEELEKLEGEDEIRVQHLNGKS